MRCVVCGQDIINRGGNYCSRCAGLHGVGMSWEQIKIKRKQELYNDSVQQRLF